MLQSIAKWTGHYVLGMQILFGLVSSVGIFCIHWSVFSFLTVLFFYFIYGGLINSVVLHRSLSHKNPLPKPIVYLAAYLTTWSLVGPALGYVAIHRSHHMSADTEKDPHSPKFKNLWALFFGIFFAKTNPVVIRDLLQDRVLVYLSKHYLLISVLSLVTLYLVFGASVFFLVIALPACLSYVTATSINYVCHNYGSRPFSTKEGSTNVALLGCLVFGEGWHNNHHADPQKFYFGRKWYELDLGGLTFFLLQKLRIK